MASLQETLSKKFGPLPLYGWLGIGGGVLALLYIRGQSGQSGQPGAAGQQQPVSPSPIIVTPTTAALPQPNQPAGTQTPPTTPSFVTAGGGVPGGGNPTGIFMEPSNAHQITSVPVGTSLQVAGSPVQGQSVTWGQTTSSSWIPVMTVGGGTGYVWAPFVGLGGGAGGGGGIGYGGGSSVKTIGRVGRFSSPHARRQYLQLPLGMGGRGAIKDVSRRSGIPEERLMALNPAHWRPGAGRTGHLVIG